MNTYLQLNILVFFASLLFALFQKIDFLSHYKFSPLVGLRFGQTLLLIALTTPIMLKLMPMNQPTLSVPLLDSLPFKQKINLSFNQSPVQIPQQPPTVTTPSMEMPIEFDVKSIAFAIWMLGLLFFTIKFGRNYSKLNKIISRSIIFKQYFSLSIMVTEEVLVPFSAQIARHKWVILPTYLLDNKKDLTLAIRHEIQHHRQGDTWWAIFIELLVCLFYFNPAIYFWKKSIIEYQELSCDEALTGQEAASAHEYGSCLLRVAEMALKNRSVLAGTTSMAGIFKDSKYFQTFLLRRIEMIVRKKRPKSIWPVVGIVPLLLLLTISFAYGLEKINRAQSRQVNGGILVVDNEIQEITDHILAKALDNSRFSAGFILVAEPMTGRVLAVANRDSTGAKQGNWALSQLFEPASIAKPLVVAHALENNVTTAVESHRCENGTYHYKGKVYRDWKSEGWPQLTTTEALAISSNICNIKIAEKLGTTSLQVMVEAFGFGQGETTEDFPGARSGDLPIIDEQFVPKMAMGYAFKNTALEILQAYGAIANGGKLVRPIMANAKGAHVINRVLSEETSEKMKLMLQEVVLSGTGRGRAQSVFYTTAGKTASGLLSDFQKLERHGNEKANFAGFIGFAPVSQPKIEVFVGLIDRDTQKSKMGARGGEHAGPVFKEVIENVLAHMKIAPDKF